MTATVTTERPIDKVSAATLEWGYTNFYRYRWAGRADSMATEMNDVWWLMGEVGTDAGSEKDTDDWVCVTRVEIPIVGGQFTGVTSSFTVPSWAPGSSDALARWSARLLFDRGGRDIDTHDEFTVLLGRDDGEVADEAQRHTAGDGETDMAIVLSSTVFVAGETINGSITLTPNVDMSDGEIGIYWATATLPSLDADAGRRRRGQEWSNGEAGQGNSAAQGGPCDGAVRAGLARGRAARG